MALVIQYKRATASRWTEINPLLAAGEPGLELGTNRVKYGDGVRRWNDLPYSAEASSGNDNSGQLTEHVNSLTPHPVYDDMESLTGLYENAKV